MSETALTRQMQDRCLAKLCGCLVIISVNVRPDPKPGKCMVCGGTEFRDAPHGWVECTRCLDFAILKSDMQRIERLSTPEMFTM